MFNTETHCPDCHAYLTSCWCRQFWQITKKGTKEINQLMHKPATDWQMDQENVMAELEENGVMQTKDMLNNWLLPKASREKIARERRILERTLAYCEGKGFIRRLSKSAAVLWSLKTNRG